LFLEKLERGRRPSPRGTLAAHRVLF
jgi:hypothetical protein